MTSVAAGKAQPSSGPPSLWRHRDFLVFWAGDAVSQIGSQVTLVVLPLAAVLTMHASGAQVGLLQALYTLPFLLLPLPVGVWLERRTRRPVMIAMDLLRSVLVVSVPVAAAAGVLDISLLYAVALLGGAATVTAEIAKVSFVPGLVPPGMLTVANSRLNAGLAVGATAGPGVAGWLTGAVGAPFALIADGVSYLLSATSLALLRHREPPPPPTEPGSRRHPRTEVAEGLRAVFAVPPIRNIALHAALYNGGLQIVSVALVVHFVRERGFGASAYGVVMLVAGIGAVLGTVVAPLLTGRLGHGPAMLAALAVGANAFWLLPAAGGDRATVATWYAFALFVASAASGLGGVVAVTVRQLLTPPQRYARMNASYRLMSFGTIPLGAAAGGLLVDLVGAHRTLSVAPLVLVASVLPLAAGPVRALGRELQP